MEAVVSFSFTTDVCVQLNKSHWKFSKQTQKKEAVRNERMTQKTDKTTSINVDFKTLRFKAAFNLSLVTIFTSN